MTKRIQCKEAKAGIRQLIGGQPFVTNFSQDEVINHVETCENCQKSIRESIEGGSKSYAENVETTIQAARDAEPRRPSNTERTGTPGATSYYGSGKEKF